MAFLQETPTQMFKWVLNTPLKLVEYNCNIYMLFEFTKLFQLIFTL